MARKTPGPEYFRHGFSPVQEIQTNMRSTQPRNPMRSPVEGAMRAPMDPPNPARPLLEQTAPRAKAAKA